MTTTTLGSVPIPNIWPKTFIGFDKIFDELQNIPTDNNYPPSNIIRVSDTKYIIELAVAGFNESQIEITLQNQTLNIVGGKVGRSSSLNYDTNEEYIHRGIGYRKFKKVFNLADHIKVREVELEDGILSIGLEKVIPEELKPKTIKIGRSSSMKSFLQE